MDPTTRLRRHEQHWNASTTSIRQVALSGIIFAVVILFNVIEPYITNVELDVQLNQLEEEERQAEQVLARMDSFLTALGEAKEITLKAPWNKHNLELQKRFKSGLISNPEKEADHTVRTIAAEIREKVVKPLEAAVSDTGLTGDLAKYPKAINDAIDVWEQEKIGQVWYSDVNSKNAEVRALGDVVTTQEDEAIAKVEQAYESVTESYNTKQAELKQLDQKITLLDEEIEQALAAALPVWAQRLVHPEIMVWLFPWIMIGLAVYIVGRALIGAQHFRGMANEEKWSPVERSDPLMSSIWTLTWRGALGTAVTVSSYSVFLLCVWYFVGRSLHLAPSQYMPAWLPHSLMALAMIAVFVTPFRQRLRG